MPFTCRLPSTHIPPRTILSMHGQTVCRPMRNDKASDCLDLISYLPNSSGAAINPMPGPVHFTCASLLPELGPCPQLMHDCLGPAAGATLLTHLAEPWEKASTPAGISLVTSAGAQLKHNFRTASRRS